MRECYPACIFKYSICVLVYGCKTTFFRHIEYSYTFFKKLNIDYTVGASDIQRPFYINQYLLSVHGDFIPKQ